ncbi:LacI family DNA-binding transcriptional regulator [Amycolatopsis sp.]|uniref:LacI family DNA-binding transcriptional regulator n=1 Tax=Amycolatopsis sp. TaxID=37632 RepID=UPI002D800BCF|nr:LacI family DNA-binding transcriptional regulator [Amycolatopsis sp.]HET6705427.1 LacI family DNA-binding transcriptional regulator [Amycolatopsis sp.]
MTRSSRRSTSEDVARAAGVSRTTVSFVLNNRPGQSIPEETRQRVLEAARRLDYRPHASARTLAAGRSDLVLLSIPDSRLGPGISRFVEELAEALAEHGLTLITHLAGARGRPLPDVCATVNASAVVGLSSFDAETAEALHRAGAEVVLPLPDPQVGVGDAMALAGRLQAEHLIGLGHRRVGYAMPVHPGLRTMADARLAGVTGACVAAGVDLPVVEEIGLEVADGSRAVTRWRSSGVTGVCAYNDETALAVLAGARDLGIAVPADLAVIGVDDIPTAKLAAPPLSTIRFDVHEAGRRRAEAIVAALSGREAEPSPDAGGPLLVRRSST